MKMGWKIFISLLLAIIVLFIGSIKTDPESLETNIPEDSTLSIVTPEPIPTVKQTAIPTPKVTPMPTPVPTETPFKVLAPTIEMSFEELVGDNGDNIRYEDIPTPPPADTFKVVVNIYYQFITIYRKDENGDYTIPVRYMICTTGKEKTPTPIGEFRIGVKRARFTKFVDYDSWAQYWTEIGTTDYYFHSLLYSKRDASYYTSSYSKLGTAVSHGCIRLMVPDARWMWYYIAEGTLVEIIPGEENQESVRIRELLVFPTYPKHRVTLVPGEIPVTEPWPGYEEY